MRPEHWRVEKGSRERRGKENEGRSSRRTEREGDGENMNVFCYKIKTSKNMALRSEARVFAFTSLPTSVYTV